MSVTKYEIRPGAYYDSVVLMQLQRDLVSLDGVQDAGVVMATSTNLALLAESGLLPERAAQAGPDDLLIVVRSVNDGVAASVLLKVDELLARRRSATEGEYRPRSLDSALKLLPKARWVLVSVPGRYAAGVAREALEMSRNVFLYSDNVPLDNEVELKKLASSKGRLVMGPDCGTAIVNGVGLGFANRVRRGDIGLVGASGTGLQAVSVHIHDLGGGVSHALGTGGRDLSIEVGATTALQCLDLLARDLETKVIVLISKPPDPQVAARLFSATRAIEKPVVVNLLGYPPPAHELGNLHFAVTLQEAARLAVELSQWEVSLSPKTDASSGKNPNPQIAPRFMRGLFSGGTLAAEALLGLRACLAPLYSNISFPGIQPLPDPTHSLAHTVVDLGADEFTVGRLHPMIDNEIRLRRLRQEAEDPEVGAVLLDVVLGEGAHPDPAYELAPAIAEVRRVRDLEVVVILIGTEEDPQVASDQAGRLAEAGAIVFHNMSEVVAYIYNRLNGRPEWPQPPVPLDSLQAPLVAVNVGLESFYHSLIDQGSPAIQVDWRPPAGGKEHLMSILAKMKS